MLLCASRSTVFRPHFSREARPKTPHAEAAPSKSISALPLRHWNHGYSYLRERLDLDSDDAASPHGLFGRTSSSFLSRIRGGPIRVDGSRRYAGHQVSPQQARALFSRRTWNLDAHGGVFKAFPGHALVANVQCTSGVTTPLEFEGLTLEDVTFVRVADGRDVALTGIEPRLFSEVMRDLDLVVSVAHVGAVDPEASASTVEMRARLVRETAAFLKLKHVNVKGDHVWIEGKLGEYSVHLGSGVVHRLPGGFVCIVPVHGQHRGRLFLPFADDDPRTAEVLSKVLLLARDDEIQDPLILEQLRALS